MQFNNKSLLHIAACCQAKSSIKCLIELGHDQDPSIFKVTYINIAYITYIIAYETFLNLMRKIAKDKEGYSPLQLASAYSQLDSTVILLRHYLQSAKFGLFIILRYGMSRIIPDMNSNDMTHII